MELRQGTQLQNGKYRIVDTLMQDDTVISYRATCKLVVDGSYGKFKTDVDVVIKEFFLNNYCRRDEAGNVFTVDQSNGELVENSKQNFKAMAKNLASMNEPDGSAKVTDIFEENGTIYYVSPLKEGQFSENRPPISQGDVPAMPRSQVNQPVRTYDPTPDEVSYGYDADTSSKKKYWLIAAIAIALIAAGAALYGIMNKGGDEQIEPNQESVAEAQVDPIANEARQQVAKDVEEINKNLPNVLNDDLTMKSASYDMDSNVLSITYEVTDKSDLESQKEDIKKGMLDGLKSNDGTGRHFREALITVKEYFKMNGTVVDQFVLTPEDYSKIKI